VEKLNEQKLPRDEIAKICDVHPFVFQQTFESRIGRWSVSSLLESLKILCDLDMAHKRGDFVCAFGLELEIIRLSEEALTNVKRGRVS
jgi:DNA polymerase III delta subunit